VLEQQGIPTVVMGTFEFEQLAKLEAKLVGVKGIDPLYSSAAFKFRMDCPSDLDCKVPCGCPPALTDELTINYLAKDYASFRQLILDRMALLVPDWTEQEFEKRFKKLQADLEARRQQQAQTTEYLFTNDYIRPLDEMTADAAMIFNYFAQHPEHPAVEQFAAMHAENRGRTHREINSPPFTEQTLEKISLGMRQKLVLANAIYRNTDGRNEFRALPLLDRKRERDAAHELLRLQFKSIDHRVNSQLPYGQTYDVVYHEDPMPDLVVVTPPRGKPDPDDRGPKSGQSQGGASDGPGGGTPPPQSHNARPARVVPNAALSAILTRTKAPEPKSQSTQTHAGSFVGGTSSSNVGLAATELHIARTARSDGAKLEAVRKAKNEAANHVKLMALRDGVVHRAATQNAAPAEKPAAPTLARLADTRFRYVASRGHNIGISPR